MSRCMLFYVTYIIIIWLVRVFIYIYVHFMAILYLDCVAMPCLSGDKFVLRYSTIVYFVTGIVIPRTISDLADMF